MKKSELSFAEGFTGSRANNNNPMMIFDWDKAASIIKERLKDDPNLTAEAGLYGDWAYTGGEIYSDGKIADDYTYLASNWATPTLIINDSEEIPCFTTDLDTRFGSGSKWDEISLGILNS